ncbi:MAG: AAA family ATPase [Novosphingobium sp.]
MRGREDREAGEHALGRALWSPQKSKSGGDIYANMRAVKPGDVVLHLTDNIAFTGISVAAEFANDRFRGIDGTDWQGDCFRITLKEFENLNPPLDRDKLFKTEPYATELKELIDGGAKGLFFNSKLDLNQGAYLTEATPTLVSILNRAYQDAAGKPLPMIGREEISEPEASADAEPYSIEDALKTLFLDKQEIEDILLLWTAKKNIVLQGPPGVGKSFAAEKLAFALMEEAERNRVGFVQFHQSYSYEDFVEGFRPTDKGFELKAGKFVQFCRKAEADPNNRYVFVIDEINRGNLSKILGELMLLIESDKRGPNWAMPVASGNVNFHVPPNVYIMGLMNTADRSLAVVDYALRRRFAFIDLKPKISSAKFAAFLAANGIGIDLSSALIGRVAVLNQEIVRDTLNLGPGFAVGHSFFCGKPLASETDTAWYRRIVKTEIAPLLREYWFDTPQRADEWEERLLEGL